MGLKALCDDEVRPGFEKSRASQSGSWCDESIAATIKTYDRVPHGFHTLIKSLAAFDARREMLLNLEEVPGGRLEVDTLIWNEFLGYKI